MRPRNLASASPPLPQLPLQLLLPPWAAPPPSLLLSLAATEEQLLLCLFQGGEA
jgi:hypothetical protein